MPIGKNAIKRVQNNGYAKVASTAPDMENSHVIANLDPQVDEKIVAPIEKKSAAKAAATKKSCAKKPAAKKSAPKKAQAAQKQEKDGFMRVELGGEMPFYLL